MTAAARTALVLPGPPRRDTTQHDFTYARVKSFYRSLEMLCDPGLSAPSPSYRSRTYLTKATRSRMRRQGFAIFLDQTT